MLLTLIAALLGQDLSLVPVPDFGPRTAQVELPCDSALGAFVANEGQWHPDVLFAANSGGLVLSVMRDGLVLRNRPVATGEKGADGRELFSPVDEVWLHFPHGAKASCIETGRLLDTKFNYHLPHGSFGKVPAFASLRMTDVFPGVDLELRRTGDGTLAYDVLVAPFFEAPSTLFEVHGGTASIRSDGSFAIDTTNGTFLSRVGAIWEIEPSGDEHALTGRYCQQSSRASGVGFQVAERTLARPLVIDPTLEYLSYSGTNIPTGVLALELDSLGAIYFAAEGGEQILTAPPGSYQPVGAGGSDFLCIKYSPNFAGLEWATYVGGTDSDRIRRAMPRSDGVVLVGHTWSFDFPVTPGAMQPQKAASTHWFFESADVTVCLLSHDGSALQWSTFYGQHENDTVADVAMASNGDICLALDTYTITSDPILLPTSPGAFDESHQPVDKYVARMASDGSSILGATYFHASSVNSAAMAPNGDFLIAGIMSANDVPLPTTPGVLLEDQPGVNSIGRGWLARFDSTCTHLRWCTYLPGSDSSSIVWDLAVDAADAVYLTAQPFSIEIATTPGALISNPVTGGGYAAKILPHGTGFAFATYVGATFGGNGYAATCGIDAAGSFVLIGEPSVPGWPITPDAFQPNFAGPTPQGDLAIAKLNAVGEAVEYGSYLGGSGGEGQAEMLLTGNGQAHIAFSTYSANLATTPNAIDTTYLPVVYGYTGLAIVDLGVEPWRVLGFGRKGAKETPNLAGIGDNIAGQSSRLALRGTEPNVPVWFAVGVSELYLPLLGGTLVPSPDAHFKLNSNALGSIDFHFPWPNLTPGAVLTFQAWCLDLGSPVFFSASNALRAIGT